MIKHIVIGGNINYQQMIVRTVEVLLNYKIFFDESNKLDQPNWSYSRTRRTGTLSRCLYEKCDRSRPLI